MPDCPDNGPYPFETPLLRADATDDDLQEEPKYALGALPPPGWVLHPATDTEPEHYGPPDTADEPAKLDPAFPGVTQEGVIHGGRQIP